MPHLGGKAPADQIKKKRPDIKVLFTSGYTDESLALHNVVGSDVPFIQKPFAPWALASQVRNALDGA
jgi:DNA-binding NtrC family response regulator